MSLNTPLPKVGKKNPQVSQGVVELLVVGTDIVFGNLQITVVNDHESAEASCRIWVSQNATGALLPREDLIDAGDIIKPYGTKIIYGKLVVPGDRVYVSATTNNLVFCATVLSHPSAS